MVLSEAASPSPEAEGPGKLHVTSPGAMEANGGAPNSLLPASNSSGGGNAADATPTPSANAAPSPNDFAQYEKYKDQAGALFGDIKAGQGAEVVAGSILTVQYRGWLTNGTLFDESYSKPAPFSFKEGDHRVIPGWEQGLLGMKVGGKRRLIVPPGAGYGPEAHSGIPGNSVLVFDVELLAVQ